MKMTCQICGAYCSEHTTNVPHNYPLLSKPAGLTVTVPTENEEFKVIFGFWDHRNNRRFDICGSCLVERLIGMHQSINTGAY